MIKIVALNDEEQIETSELEDVVVATREAQEAIAENEYIRAIKLKAEGKTELALNILNELLSTQVLNEGNNVEKLMYIKYNCHKNIALILEERCDYEMALQNYIAAILIDNTDVYTLHKFGQLALKLQSTDLAEYAFENCLGNNGTHWRAAEGMLKTRQHNGNIIGTYNTALQISRRDFRSKTADETLRGIVTFFKPDLEIFKQCGGTYDKYSSGIANQKESKWLLESIKNRDSENHNVKEPLDPNAKSSENVDFQNLSIGSLTWISIGQFILDLYAYANKAGFDKLLNFNITDFIKDPSCSAAPGELQLPTDQVAAKNEEQEVTSSVQNNVEMDQNKLISAENCDVPIVVDSNNEDSDSNNKSDGGDTNRNKARRRCSDLHFLEQWGWHKNRRYSSRKKAEKEETDDSLNSYLRRTFSKYMQDIAGGKWPFNDNNSSEDDKASYDNFNFQCLNCQKSNRTEEVFQKETESEFEKFLEKLQATKIDLMLLIYKWLKYVSLFWQMPLPEELKNLYIEIFSLYITHFDLSSWNQLTASNYEASFRLCLLYLELTANREMFEDVTIRREVFHHLCFNFGICKSLISTNIQNVFELRLAYMKYLLYTGNSQYNECLRNLEEMYLVLENCEDQSNFVLHLPNSKICLSSEFIVNIKKQYKSQIDISNIPKLFERELWLQLSELIITNIDTCKNNYKNDNWLKDFLTMMEILLQCQWKMSSYDSCLIWSEKCFHYAVSHYLEESKSTLRQKLLAEFINFTSSYVEAVILNEGFSIIEQLSTERLSRMIQNFIRLLVYQFEGNFDKNSSHGSDLDFKRPWIILHQLLLRDEENKNNTISCDTLENPEEFSESVPSTFLLLFTAHEHLGKRQWCSKDQGEFLQYILDAVVGNLKAPIFDSCRDLLYEYIEQVTYCLFKYPQKKARSKHLEDHEAEPIKLTWLRAVQLIDLYKPEQLPEFNSYKLESITADMEQMLIKIIYLLPKDLDPSPYTSNVSNYIEGHSQQHPSEFYVSMLPYKVINLYYLMADFYFKNRDFTKAIKFYTLDLVVNPSRFDSWAGIALSKSSQIETKLNGLDHLSLESLWEECEQVLRCFECCINLNRLQTLLWIEYGSFCYIIHSYMSRFLKNRNNNLEQTLEAAESLKGIEQRKTKLLNIAHNCFSLTNSLQNSAALDTEDNNDSNDEKWLCQYMLGKIAEKRKEEPKMYMNHYLLAANYLYESNATYPIKINHSNPTALSVEALEVFYRLNAAIIKFISHEKTVSRSNGDLFNKVLRNLSNSPFAFNKAKIDGNILKRKMDAAAAQNVPDSSTTDMANKQMPNIKAAAAPPPPPPPADANEKEKSVGSVPSRKTSSRRNSQESSLSVARSSSTSTVLSTDSSSGDSESDSDTEASMKATNDVTYSLDELKTIYRMVIQNIEECATRFPEHYKSIYRLVYHFMYSPPEYCNLEVCEQLLLGQYKTSLGNIVNGLFYERKNNNLFNGIWRIPSSEIDRPGSFSAHLIKCVKIFITLLKKTNNHKILMDIAVNLYKTPDVDKRYIADAARKDLYQQCISYTVEILRAVLEKNQKQRDDNELMDLQLDIYKIHKKCIKYMSHKESTFTKLLTDVYKFFIEDKVQHIPENYNLLDLAIKLCLQELTSRKLIETRNAANPNAFIPEITIAPRTFNIPGLSMYAKNRNPLPSSNMPTFKQSSNSFADIDKIPAHQYVPMLMPSSYTDNPTSDFLLLQGYYANLLEQQKSLNLEAKESPNSNSAIQNLQSSTALMETENPNPLTLSSNSMNDLQQQLKSKSSFKNKKGNYSPYPPPARPFLNDNITFENNNNMNDKYEGALNPAYVNFLKSNNASPNQQNYPTQSNLAGSGSSTVSINMFEPKAEGVKMERLPAKEDNNPAPMKTLQQKLAERQKSYQLQKSPANTVSDTKTCEDVIILD